MKKVIKENTVTIKDTVWVATDGTEFVDEQECAKYEHSARCALITRINKFLVSITSECDIYGAGSDDYMIQVYHPITPEDKNALLQYYYLEHLKEENPYRIGDLEKDLLVEDAYYMFGGDSYSSVYYQGTVEHKLKDIESQLYNLSNKKVNL